MLTLLNVIYVRNCNGRFGLAFGMKLHAKNCTQNACISNFLYYMSLFSNPLQEVTWGKSSYSWKWNEIQLLQNQDQWRYLRKFIPTNCSGSQVWPSCGHGLFQLGNSRVSLGEVFKHWHSGYFFLSIGQCLIIRVLPLVSGAKVSSKLQQDSVKKKKK